MNHQQATDHKIPPVQKPMKRSFLHYALAGSVSITLLTGTALAEVIPVPETVSPKKIAETKPRNVVFILSDDHRYDEIGRASRRERV